MPAVWVVFGHCASSSDSESRSLRSIAIEKQDSLVFETGFPVVPRHTGSMVDSNGRLHYYFADPVTNKRLIFFDEQGRFERTYSIAAAVDSLGEVGSVTVVSFDSILLCRMKVDRIAFADTNGRCWKVMSFKDKLVNSSGDRFELGPGPNGSTYWRGSLFLRSYWRANERDDSSGSAPKREPGLAFINYSGRHHIDAPYGARVALADGRVDWFLLGFYGRMGPKPCAYNESPRFAVAGGDVIAYTRYSPEFAVVDPVDLNVKKWVDASVCGMSVHYDPPALDGLDWDTYVRSVKELQSAAGSIDCVWSNDEEGLKFVSVRGPQKENGDRDLALLVFSNTWSYLGTAAFPGPPSHYLGFYLPSAKGGFYLKRSESLAERSAPRHVFDRFVVLAGR